MYFKSITLFLYCLILSTAAQAKKYERDYQEAWCSGKGVSEFVLADNYMRFIEKYFVGSFNICRIALNFFYNCNNINIFCRKGRVANKLSDLCCLLYRRMPRFVKYVYHGGGKDKFEKFIVALIAHLFDVANITEMKIMEVEIIRSSS